MASIRKEILTSASPDETWEALRDVGALHTRLVPRFVTDNKMRPGERVVTFGNGMVIREPIVAIDDAARRVVWAAKGKPLTHYNASAQAFTAENGGTKVVWIADLLRDDAGPIVEK